MQLTETQITQANALIAKYKFCSLETQKRLQEAGFFENVGCNMCITAHRYNKEMPCDVETIESALPYGETIEFLPMPQFHEVWEALPEKIHWYENVYYPSLDTEKGIVRYQYAGRTKVSEEIKDRNICEAACLLWLKLKENNLL